MYGNPWPEPTTRRNRFVSHWPAIGTILRGAAQASGVRFAGLDTLPTKGQERAYGVSWRWWEKTGNDCIFMLLVIMLRKSFDVLPPPMRRIVVSMDSPVHMLPVPMMGKPTLLDL